MKLTKDQKSELKVLLDMSQDAGIQFISDKHHGVTTGWYRNFPGSKMITVATSYFDSDESDKFRTKTGLYFVLQRLFNMEGEGQFMQLPLGHLEDNLINWELAELFAIE